MRLPRWLLLLLVLSCLLLACHSPSRLDQALPFADRRILAERIIWARDAQLAAGSEFLAALDRYEAVTTIGGDPEAQYRLLWHSNEQSRNWAENVRSHIDSVEEIGRGLFNQWELELGHYQNERLRNGSRRYLGEVREPYQQLLHTMRQTEVQLLPLQAGFNDQFLLLKHGLDPQQRELRRLRAEVSSYLRAVEDSVREADAFLARLQQVIDVR
jgi:hypothetical protein